MDTTEGREVHGHPAPLNANTKAKHWVEPCQLPKDPAQFKLDKAKPNNETGTTPEGTIEGRGTRYHGYPAHEAKRLKLNATMHQTKADSTHKVVPPLGPTKNRGTHNHAHTDYLTGMTEVEPRQPPHMPGAPNKTNPKLQLPQAKNMATTHDKPPAQPPR